MKLHILSDLHLTVGALEVPANEADAVILAGDVARPKEAVAWALRFAKPVFYVAGNHEFYGDSIPGTMAELKRLCAGTAVHVLDNDEAVFGGVRLLGTTLWSDFMLFGMGPHRTAAVQEALKLMRDFSRIRLNEGDDRLFKTAIKGSALDAGDSGGFGFEEAKKEAVADKLDRLEGAMFGELAGRAGPTIHL